MLNKVSKTAALCSAVIALCALSARAGGSFGLDKLSLKDMRQGRVALSDVATPQQSDGRTFTVNPKPLPAKDLTVMIFLNGKNNLEQIVSTHLDNMKQVGSTDKMNIVVEAGILSNKTVRRILITKGGETVYETQQADMGDYKEAGDFIRWSKAAFPAKKYIFIIWDHGIGYLDPKPKKGEMPDSRGISFDDDTKNYIRTSQMGEIFKIGGHVDIFAGNSCLTQMAEVAYTMKDGVDLIIGSEEVMSGMCFEYQKVLGWLAENSGASNEDFGKQMNVFYGEAYETCLWGVICPLKDKGGTLSSIRSDRLDALPGKLDAWAKAVQGGSEEEAVKYAMGSVIRFAIMPDKDNDKKLTPYADLGDFVLRVDSKAKSQAVHEQTEQLMNFIDTELVSSKIGVHSDKHGDDYSKTHGVAINMAMEAKPVPDNLKNAFEGKYSDLAFAKAGGWSQFVDWVSAVWNK
ncbi:MAG: clostripain-related cysteine peptidase [Elusimicrobiales bacterium]